MAAQKVQHMMLVRILFVCLLLESHVYSMQCRSKTGDPVDWFVIYKMPKIPESGDDYLRKGIAFYYMDDNNPTLSLAETAINEFDGNPLVFTLKPIYESNATGPFSYVLYNDQTPNSTNANHGHTKGVLGFDKNSGFWLVHSVPKFPPYINKGLDFSGFSLTNGQTFLCMSILHGHIDNTVGNIFRYNYPNVYDKELPSEFLREYPTLKKLLYGHRFGDIHVTTPPWQTRIKVQTIGGGTFFAYAKYSNFGRDLYDGFLSGCLEDDLLVQTWRTARTEDERLPSNCTIPHKVYNIKMIKFIYKGKQIEFDSTKDHSKWAISKKKTWLCIGDINRTKSQFKRGGGQVCFENERSRESFRKLVYQLEKCPDSI